MERHSHDAVQRLDSPQMHLPREAAVLRESHTPHCFLCDVTPVSPAAASLLSAASLPHHRCAGMARGSARFAQQRSSFWPYLGCLFQLGFDVSQLELRFLQF